MTLTPYTQKSADVSAGQWLPDASNTLSILSDFFSAVLAYDASHADPRIHVQTPDGPQIAYPGYWFTKTAAGEVSIHKPDDFSSDFTAK